MVVQKTTLPKEKGNKDEGGGGRGEKELKLPRSFTRTRNYIAPVPLFDRVRLEAQASVV